MNRLHAFACFELEKNPKPILALMKTLVTGLKISKLCQELQFTC